MAPKPRLPGIIAGKFKTVVANIPHAVEKFANLLHFG